MPLTLFWILSIALCLGIASLILTAMRRASRALNAQTPDSDVELSVYKEQLREVEAETAAGRLEASESARLRTEIGRRVLALDARAQSTHVVQGPGFWVTFLGLVMVFALGAGLYIQMGAYGYSDRPLAARLDAAQTALTDRLSQQVAEAQTRADMPTIDAELQALLDELRQAMKDNPDRVEGWSLLARNEARIGNFSAAWRAQDQLIALKAGAASAQDYAILADMLIQAAGGYVSPQAQAALGQALTADRTNSIARYYTGLMMAQIGRPDVALGYWDVLLREGPESAPWISLIRAQINTLSWQAGQPNYTPPTSAPAVSPAPGPSAEDIEAASDLTPQERMGLIQSMVEGLSERLAEEGGPVEDWARLITSLSVLGEKARAGAILTEAKTHFGLDEGAMALLAQAAQQAGLSF